MQHLCEAEPLNPHGQHWRAPSPIPTGNDLELLPSLFAPAWLGHPLVMPPSHPRALVSRELGGGRSATFAFILEAVTLPLTVTHTKETSRDRKKALSYSKCPRVEKDNWLSGHSHDSLFLKDQEPWNPRFLFYSPPCRAFCTRYPCPLLA